MSFLFPRVYPILDASQIPSVGRAEFLGQLGQSLFDAGVTLLEYRNKTGADAELLADARTLRAVLPAGKVKLIVDDRADLVDVVGFDGAHVDAGDMPPAQARHLLGSNRIIGTSAGSEEQLAAALDSGADYIAFGPVFPTITKQTTASPIGVEGVRRFRALVGPGPVLVAAAGITLDTAPAILQAGASSVAVSAAIFRCADPAAEFRRWRTVID